MRTAGIAASGTAARAQLAPVALVVDGRGVAYLSLQRPDHGNAYDGELLESWHVCLDELEARKGLRAVVLSGEGRNFQVGADLRWLAAVREGGDEANDIASVLTATAFERQDRLPVPVICLIQGGCFGGGTGLAAASDIVVASQTATFSVAEVRWGLEPSIILPLLTRAMSPRHVRRYAVTAESFDAAEAARIGLVHEVVAPGDLASRGEQIVSEILRNAPEAVRRTKQHLRDGSRDELIRAHSKARRSQEADEGLAAFAARRPPTWEGPSPTDTKDED